MIGKQDIVHFYEHFYRQKYENIKYKFSPTPRANQQIDNFIKYLDSKYKLQTIGNKFLSRYFSFQFKRIENQVFKRFSSVNKGGRVQIYDIIGKKPFQDWLDRNTKFDFIIEPTLSVKVEQHKEQVPLSRAEEIQKQKYYNTNKGLVNCLQATSLFNHRSPLCILCDHKVDCKKILQINFNTIYINRGYVKST